MFIPAMVFGLLIDFEILIQVAIYKPIAFKETPKYCRQALAILSGASLIMSGLLIFFSFLAFTPSISAKQFVRLFFICLCIKAGCWSPFIAFEYYDTFFENIYYDVQW